MSHTVPPLKDKSLLKDQTYINGKWVRAKSGKTFDVVNPASNQVIGTMPDMNEEDTLEAIAAAEVAFQSFRRTTPRERGRLLRAWYQLIMDNANDIVKLITWVS